MPGFEPASAPKDSPAVAAQDSDEHGYFAAVSNDEVARLGLVLPPAPGTVDNTIRALSEEGTPVLEQTAPFPVAVLTGPPPPTRQRTSEGGGSSSGQGPNTPIAGAPVQSLASIGGSSLPSDRVFERERIFMQIYTPPPGGVPGGCTKVRFYE